MKLKSISTLIADVVTCTSLNAQAYNSVAATTKVTAVYTYGLDTSHHNKLHIKVTSAPAGCSEGYWVSKEDNDANSGIRALLLSAFHAKSKIYIAAYSDMLWAGGTAQICKIHSIGVVE